MFRWRVALVCSSSRMAKYSDSAPTTVSSWAFFSCRRAAAESSWSLPEARSDTELFRLA